jgi:hypothetical protein
MKHFARACGRRLFGGSARRWVAARCQVRQASGLVLALLLVAITTSAVGQMPDLKPLKGTPNPSAPKDPDHFVFIVAGDNRPSAEKDPQGDVVRKIFDDVKRKGSPFVLWTGDTIYGKDPDEPKKIAAEYKEFLGMAAAGGAAVYNAPGNHELDDHNNCPSGTMLKRYLADAGQDEPYGAFNYGNSRFIAMSSDERSAPKECNCRSQPSGTKPPGFISENQITLLKRDLEANKDKAHIFLFLHRPIEGYKNEDQLCPKNVAELQALFKKYANVSYVLAGHQHMYFNPQGPEEFGPPPERTDPSQPPYYLVSGGAGAPLKKKGFYHYLIFTVDGNKVSVQVVPVKEKNETK